MSITHVNNEQEKERRKRGGEGEKKHLNSSFHEPSIQNTRERKEKLE